MAKLKPDFMSYRDLIADIDGGLIKIPAFQRDFVWELNDTIALLDSICRGYPIGSFLFWESNDYLHSLRNIGNLSLPEVPEGRFVRYVLDGQQRITSLYAAVKEARVNGKKYVVYYDLEKRQFANPTDLEEPVDEDRYISLAKILDEVNHLTNALKLKTSEMQQAFSDVFVAFTEYPFPYVNVKGQPIDVVCDIFERVNTRGKKLTVVDLMVAKTWSKDFDLKVKLEEFREKLAKSDYSEIDDINVLQAISCMMVDGCRRAEILGLKKADLANFWDDAIRAIELGIDFIRGSIGIPISRVLPFSVQIVIPAYFYYKNNFKDPNDWQARELGKWFWKSSLSNRYDSGVETKIGDDIKQVSAILGGKDPSFNYTVSITNDKIINQPYTLRNAFCLTILSLYASRHPRNFRNNAAVDLTSKNFSKYNSKEMHHVFPRSFLKKVVNMRELENSIANICFIPASLNKDISDDPPSKYFAEFALENVNLTDTLSSHLIGDPKTFGITTDNFQTFLWKRAEAIKNELARLADVSVPLELKEEVNVKFELIAANEDQARLDEAES
jgi:hypothetical protein